MSAAFPNSLFLYEFSAYEIKIKRTNSYEYKACFTKNEKVKNADPSKINKPRVIENWNWINKSINRWSRQSPISQAQALAVVKND